MCGPWTSAPRPRHSSMMRGKSGTTRVPKRAIAAIVDVSSIDRMSNFIASHGATFVRTKRLEEPQHHQPDQRCALPATEPVLIEAGGSEPPDDRQQYDRPDECRYQIQDREPQRRHRNPRAGGRQCDAQAW